LTHATPAQIIAALACVEEDADDEGGEVSDDQYELLAQWAASDDALRCVVEAATEAHRAAAEAHRAAADAKATAKAAAKAQAAEEKAAAKAAKADAKAALFKLVVDAICLLKTTPELVANALEKIESAPAGTLSGAELYNNPAPAPTGRP
jgi:hypothetical protein